MRWVAPTQWNMSLKSPIVNHSGRGFHELHHRWQKKSDSTSKKCWMEELSVLPSPLGVTQLYSSVERTGHSGFASTSIS